MPVVQPPGARQQLAALVGEVQAVRTPVDRDAPQQSASLQAVEQWHEVGLLDPQRRARARLQHAGIGIDHREHGEVRGPQVELVERVDEVLEDLQLRAAQRVSHVLGERPELAGDLGMKRVHVPVLRDPTP